MSAAPGHPGIGRFGGRDVVRTIVGAVVIGGTPVGRIQWYYDSVTGPVVTAVVVALVASAVLWSAGRWIRSPWSRSIALALTAAAGGLAIQPSMGWSIALLQAVTIGIGGWGVHRIAPLPMLPASDGTMALPIGGLMVAAGQEATGVGAVLPPVSAALLAATAVPLAISWDLAPMRRLRVRIAALRVGPRVAAVVLGILFAVAAVPLLALPWLLQRIVRWDPLRRRPAGWVRRVPQAHAARDARQIWFAEQAAGGAAWGRRIHAVALTAIVLTAAVVVATDPFDRSRSDDLIGHIQGIVRDRQDVQEANTVLDRLNKQSYRFAMAKEMETAITKAGLTQYAGIETADVDGTYLNVEGGVRQSWGAPDVDDCGAVDVWMYGGSTMFGVEIRDDFTIPSYLAKVAWKHGIRLRMKNWGVVADVSWQENRRLERSLETTADRPDLVVYYDGFNDVSEFGEVGSPDRGAPGDFIGPLDRLQIPAIKDMGTVNGGEHLVIDVPEPGSTDRTPREIGRAAAAQYRAAHQQSEVLARSYRYDMVRFVQPSLWTRPRVKGEPRGNPDGPAWARAFREQLPPEAIDLGDLMDGIDRPLYLDDIHTDDDGNEVIATGIYPHLESRLQALAARKEAACS